LKSALNFYFPYSESSLTVKLLHPLTFMMEDLETSHLL